MVRIKVQLECEFRKECRNGDNNFEKLFCRGELKSDQQLKVKYNHACLSVVTKGKLSISIAIIIYIGIEGAVERTGLVTW